MLFRSRFLECLSSRFEIFFDRLSSKILLFFAPRPNTRHAKMQHSPHENVFFKGTPSRHRRQSDDDPGTKNNDKCRSTNRGIQEFLLIVRVPQGPAAKMYRNGSPEAPARPSPGRLKSINFSAQVATRRRPMSFFHAQIWKISSVRSLGPAGLV